jgi:hypothetical protein
MKNILLLSSLLSLLTSCLPESKTKRLTYQNIVIISDMSSRLDNKPQKDTAEIKKILDYFVNECVKPGEKIGDKSAISFSTSRNMISLIDIGKIKNLGEKQQFVNSTGKYKKSGLDQKIKEFKHKVVETYSNTKQPGLDLISILIDKIENESIIKKNNFLTNGIDTTYIDFENHIKIFTDGYLEYYGKSDNDQFYFGNPEIIKIRDICRSKGINISEALEQNESLRLPPYKESKFKNINLHILETHQRDKNEELQKYDNGIGLRDNEILEAVWSLWAEESGFKSFKWEVY